MFFFCIYNFYFNLSSFIIFHSFWWFHIFQKKEKTKWFCLIQSLVSTNFNFHNLHNFLSQEVERRDYKKQRLFITVIFKGTAGRELRLQVHLDNWIFRLLSLISHRKVLITRIKLWALLHYVLLLLFRRGVLLIVDYTR